MARVQFSNPIGRIGGFGRLVLVVVLLLGGLVFASKMGWIKPRRSSNSEVPTIGKISGDYKKEKLANVPKLPLPSGDELSGKVFVTINMYDWHANSALPFGNGGPVTLENSIIGQENLIVKLAHQDDTSISTKAAVAKVKEWKESGGKSGGNLAFTIMGNAAVSIVEPLNAAVKEFDPTYRFIAVDLIGKSDGEDQIIGPVEWLKSPELMKGKFLLGVYDDGDMMLQQQLSEQISLPFNFDTKTYCPDAVNVINVSDFKLAGKHFLANTVFDSRPVVDLSGKPTGKTTKDIGVTVMGDGLASWTPVDRNIYVALKKDNPARLKGLATITSTGQGEYRKVMPCVLIVFNKWAEANSGKLEKLSYAIHKSAIQVEAHPDALQKAMEYNYQLLGEWDDGGASGEQITARVQAYKGFTAPDSKLHIGGSTVFSYKDALAMLGADDNAVDLENSTYASVYRVFGEVIVRKYPEKEVRSFEPFSKFFDPRYLLAAYKRAKAEGYGTTELVSKPDFTSGDAGDLVGSANFTITFEPGKATFGRNASPVLRTIQDKYALSEYGIRVVGHTDRTGSQQLNDQLSLDRANAVKRFLISANKQAFGGDRVTTSGKGSSEPPVGAVFSSNGDCAACRRVQIEIYRK